MFHVPEHARVTSGPLASIPAYGNNGFFVIRFGAFELRCQVSDGGGWEHVSVTKARPGHQAKKAPNWDDMVLAKGLFWDDEDTVIQLHPPKRDYVNHHPACLHLWRPIGVEIPLPDPIFVGPRP